MIAEARSRWFLLSLACAIPVAVAARAQEHAPATARASAEAAGPADQDNGAAEIEFLRRQLRSEPLTSSYPQESFDLVGGLTSHRTWTRALPLGGEQVAALGKLDVLLREGRTRSYYFDADYPAADLASYMAYVSDSHARRLAALRRAQCIARLGLLTEPQAGFVMQRVLTTRELRYSLTDENVQDRLGMTKSQRLKLKWVMQAIWTRGQEYTPLLEVDPEKQPQIAAALAATRKGYRQEAMLGVLTLHQLDILLQLTREWTLPAEPPALPALADAQAARADLYDRSPTFAHLARLSDALDLSDDQHNHWKDLEEVTELGLAWIGLQHSDDPDETAEQRSSREEQVSRRRAEFLAHAEQFLLLGILSRSQAAALERAAGR